MKLTSDLVYGFTSTILLSRFDSPKPIPEFHRELWDYMCSGHKKVAIAAPRGHAKSTAVTHSFVLANACFKTKCNIMILSDTEGQATDFLRDIKSEFIENEALIKLFGVKKLLKDRETELIVEFDDDHQCRIFAKGSNQNVRGSKWRNRRPDLIVGDDLENDEIVMNEERRRKFRTWFYNALLPCGSDDCVYRIVGTILHLDALLERMMPELGGKHTVVEPLKQYSSVPIEWHSIRYRGHDEDYSSLLWPEKFNEERYKEIRAGYIAQGFPEGYSQEYLNYPIDEITAYFQKKDFLPIDMTDEKEPEDFYIAADLAISQKKQAAFTVFAVVSINSEGRLRVRDIERFRGDSLDIIDTLFNLNKRYHPEVIFVEQENIARTLGPVLNKEMQERDEYLNIEPVTATQDKIKRARGLQARMRAGMVEWDTEAEWFHDCFQEMIHFPRAPYMDQVDALAWIAIGLDSIFEAPTQQELEDEEYEDEVENSMFSEDRNWITGY
jgi:predicted phage terminase large subunit-like protein